MTPNSGATNTTLITFVVVVFVIVRFLYMELKARIVNKKTIWVRPAFLVVVSALLIVLSLNVSGVPPAMIGLMAVAGAVVGWMTGALVLRFTTFTPVGQPGAVRVLGSKESVIVWVVALALRFAVRYLFANGGDAVQFALNAFTIVLVTVAFIVVALGFHRAIDRYANGRASPAVTS